MTEMKATIRNRDGIHCRPSAVILKAVEGYGGKVRAWNERGSTDLTSVLELLSMELLPGCEVMIRVEGPNQEVTCKELVALFETDFNFSHPMTPASSID